VILFHPIYDGDTCTFRCDGEAVKARLMGKAGPDVIARAAAGSASAY